MEETKPLRRILQPLSGQRSDEPERSSCRGMRQKLEARWQDSRLIRSTAKAPSAPVDRPQVRLRDGDVEAFRNLAHSVVSRTLAHESEYRRTGYPELEVCDWKLLKRQNGLCVYQRKSCQELQSTLGQENGIARQPTSLCVGRVDGSLEDMLYGMHCKTRKEMYIADTFRNKSHANCAVLAMIERGSNRDPFRQLAVKWIMAQTGGSKAADFRDLCILESIGSGVDGHGERFGYRLVKSVDLSDYPQMDMNVVRAKMTMCCIFRQNQGSHGVRVYAKGMVDAGESSSSSLSNNTATCSMLLSIAHAMEIAEAKRLTLLALQHAEYAMCTSFSTKLEVSQLSNGSRVTESTMICPVSPTHSAVGPRGSFLQKVPSDPCHVCGRKPRMTKLVRATYRTCGVCNQRVCHKCQVKRRLIARTEPVTVTCCKVCIIASKRICVDPRDPCPCLRS